MEGRIGFSGMSTLTIYGATGYTGRLCAMEAARRGLPLRIAGRNRTALDALAEELTPRPDIAVADATGDPAGLAALAESSDVLVSTVGPYATLGRPVVDAALAGGCHYLDVSGEVGFLDWAYRQHDRALAAGVALCPGFGFDGVPGELMAAVSARALDAPSVTEARVAYLVRGGRVSAGTARSALGVAAGGGAAWVNGHLIEEPAGAARWKVPFPEPLGRRGALSIPLPEVLTVSRSTGAETVRSYLVAPASGPLSQAAGAFGTVTRALARTPVWSLIRSGAGLLPEGPSDEARAKARAAVLAEVASSHGSQSAWARLRDIYGTTAVIAASVAEGLLAHGPPHTGALTPSQALGDDVGGFLDEIGADWSLL
jgi:short subunit dehydrogenase-like uncharacterized protein